MQFSRSYSQVANRRGVKKRWGQKLFQSSIKDPRRTLNFKIVHNFLTPVYNSRGTFCDIFAIEQSAFEQLKRCERGEL